MALADRVLIDTSAFYAFLSATDRLHRRRPHLSLKTWQPDIRLPFLFEKQQKAAISRQPSA